MSHNLSNLRILNAGIATRVLHSSNNFFFPCKFDVHYCFRLFESVARSCMVQKQVPTTETEIPE